MLLTINIAFFKIKITGLIALSVSGKFPKLFCYDYFDIYSLILNTKLNKLVHLFRCYPQLGLLK
jgi:hypothetical protein